MSLIKQLWLAVLGIVFLTFISGFAISMVTARNYYEEQLSVKNNDAAQAMALTLSTLSKEPTEVALALSSQFDTGHYQRIELISAQGQTLFLKTNQDQRTSSDWLAKLVQFSIEDGVAQVQDGWSLYGTLYVESATDYALLALWRVSIKLFFWFSLIALFCGFLGTYLMRLINRPLDKVVAQAEALGERRFITSDEPNTLEFKRLVSAMNRLTERVRFMFAQEAKNLENLQKKTQMDAVLPIANREYFINSISARMALTEPFQDALILLSVRALAEINNQLGRDRADAWLGSVVQNAQNYLEEQGQRVFLGRLNGTDIAISVRDCVALNALASGLMARLKSQCDLAGIGLPVLVVGRYYSHEASWPRLMQHIDQLLANIEDTAQKINISTSDENLLFKDAQEWRAALQEALNNNEVSIACFPARRFSGELLHQEALLRIKLKGDIYSARTVLGWAKRAGLLPQIELKVIQLALEYISIHRTPVAVNISMALLLEGQSYAGLKTLLDSYDLQIVALLAFEVDEYTAVKEPLLFASFAALVRGFGVQLGLQAAGHKLSQVKDLERLGLEYIKVDSALVQKNQEHTQALVQSVAKLSNSLGLVLVAESVLDVADCAYLQELGFDALTGPATEALIV